MATEHNVISDGTTDSPYDGEIHEPKGASRASTGEVYVSDGAASGAWAKLEGDNLGATGETYGAIITADGSGGAAYGQLVWKDIIGIYAEDTSGPTQPTKSAFKSPVDAFAYSVADAAEYYFHIPHDYAAGTDIYLHAHWGHNGTSISGNMIWDITATVCQRSAAVPYTTFGANISPTINSNTISGTMNITNFPQYCHAVEEIQLSSSSPTASQFNTSNIAVDGLILVHITANTIPTIGGGTPNEPYLFNLDIHYQANVEGTKNKDPNFYT